ncbi:Ig-like domain-containing protein [Macrococcoides canis]|uniref:Ig-like domain-containing protein n=1 Tax=Macrococcoides canis TaxID=1855823 RepID=UPI0022B8C2D3|nr:Ig-like domain-containing protein [Macrococcus canis]WBF52463.1 Ig-like domain-containing protein [Macrococcus canis]
MKRLFGCLMFSLLLFTMNFDIADAMKINEKDVIYEGDTTVNVNGIKMKTEVFQNNVKTDEHICPSERFCSSQIFKINKAVPGDEIKIITTGNDNISETKIIKIKPLISQANIHLGEGGKLTEVDTGIGVYVSIPKGNTENLIVNMYNSKGVLIAKAPVNKEGMDGKFASLKFSKQPVNSKIYFNVTDGKYYSGKKQFVVQDGIPPKKPQVKTIYASNGFVYVKTEKYAKVTVYVGNYNWYKNDTWYGSKKADKYGNVKFTIPKYSPVTGQNLLGHGQEIHVTATDKAYNTSAVVTKKVVDNVPPAPAKKLTISKDKKKLTGYGEAGTTVHVYYKDTFLGSAITNQDGRFFVKMSKQKPGRILTVQLMDAVGNESKLVKYKVK